jgi:hypothetical protein
MWRMPIGERVSITAAAIGADLGCSKPPACPNMVERPRDIRVVNLRQA